jgi:Methyltransferase domain
MAINRSIPGQLFEEEMQAIESLAALVPEDGVVVEIGALLGRSSWIWGTSVDPSVMVHSIDPWELAGPGGFSNFAQNNQQVYTVQQFKENLTGCANVVPHPGYSPQDFQSWTTPIDLYFEDAVHTNPILASNLDFWSKRVKHAGILCGHDYTPRFPDVVAGAASLANRFKRTVRTVRTLWFLLPDGLMQSANPGVRSALARLDRLEKYASTEQRRTEKEDAKAFRRRVVSKISSFRYEMKTEPAGAIEVRPGEKLAVRGEIKNVSGVDWPVIIDGIGALQVGAELYAGAARKKIAVGRFHIPAPELRAGETVRFAFDLPTARLVEPAEMHIDLLYEMTLWFRDRGADEAIIPVRNASVQQARPF